MTIQLFYTYISRDKHDLILQEKLHDFPKEYQEHVLKLRKWQDAQLTVLGRLLLKESMNRNQQEFKQKEIAFGEYNKPYLKDNPIHFNISHSNEIALCALCRDQSIGVDIEMIAPIEVHDFFNQMTPFEIETIKNSVDKVRSLFVYWTQKEAVIKADGHGLSIPLKSFEVRDDKATLNSKTSYHLQEIMIDPSYACHIATTDKIATDRIVVREIPLDSLL